VDEYSWTEDASAVDFGELSELYRIAPLGIKPPDALKTVFGHSMFVCSVYAGDALAGAGRALADGLDCAYIADVAVHPEHQGRGLGQAIILRLVARADRHKLTVGSPARTSANLLVLLRSQRPPVAVVTSERPRRPHE
jgi:GNAT superfamily N-acetyltransferase